MTEDFQGMAEDIVHYVHFSAGINQQSINALVDALQQCAAGKNRDVQILFNSEGGGVWPGQHARTMLQSYPGKLSICNVGVVHSTAVPVFLAADHRACAPAATFAFHNITRTFGAGASLNAKEAEIAAAASDAETAAMVEWIVERTSLDASTAAELCAGHGSVIRSAQWALDNGFVDSIDDPQIPSGRPMQLIR